MSYLQISLSSLFGTIQPQVTLIKPCERDFTNKNCTPVGVITKPSILMHSAEDLSSYVPYFNESFNKVNISPVASQLVFMSEGGNSPAFEWLFIGSAPQSLLSEDVEIEDLIYRKVKEFKSSYFEYIDEIKAGKITNSKSGKEKNSILQFENEGYYMHNTEYGIFIIAPSAHGLFNGLQTFLQIVSYLLVEKFNEHDTLAEFEVVDFPSLEIRAFHFDLKYLTPTFEYITDFINFLAATKTNHIIIEYEDKFPYQDLLKPFNQQYTFTEEQIEKIKVICSAHFIKITPLIQIFGHTETFIRNKEFEELQETPDGQPLKPLPRFHTFSLCPLHPNTDRMVFAMVDQIIAGHKESKYIHIGADEVYQLGTCPRCKEFLKNHTKSELYINHINKVAQRILDQGKIPIMWHDYLLKYSENLSQLDKRIVIMYWIYQTWRKPESTDVNPTEEKEKVLPHFEFFHEQGYKTMGAPSISSDFDPLVPNYRTRLENIAGQAARASESGSMGLLNTSWVVCANPLETQKIGLFLGQAMMWHPPSAWNALDWKKLDTSAQIHILGIPTENQKPWLYKFSVSTEHLNRKRPSTEASQVLTTISDDMISLEQSISNTIINPNAIVTIQSFGFGLELRLLQSKIFEIIDKLTAYAESDQKYALFPTDEEITSITNMLKNAQFSYLDIVKRAKQFFIQKYHQIQPGDMDRVFGIFSGDDDVYERYKNIMDYKDLAEAFERMHESLGEVLTKSFSILMQ